MQGSGGEVLQEYIESLTALSEMGVPGARERQSIYGELLRLVSASPYEFTPISLTANSGTWQFFSEALRQIFKAAETTFVSRNSKGEMVDALDDFIRAVRGAGNHSLLEARILLRTAERWLKVLRLEDEDDLLMIEAVLSLDLRHIEEDLAKEGTARVILPLALTNCSFSETSDVEIHLQAVSEALELAADEAKSEPDTPNHFKKKLPGTLKRKERLPLAIPFSYREQGTVRIWAEYANRSEGGSRVASNVLEIELAARTHGSEAGHLPNPYIPDLPLLSETQWEALAKGIHKDLLAQLVTDNSLETGRVLVVRGCRRTGKTTLLRRLYAETERRGKLLPVYIDIYLWYLELNEKQETVNGEALYYEFASAVLDAAEALLEVAGLEEEVGTPQLDPIRTLLARYKDTMTLPAYRFDEFMLAVEGAVGRKVLLIIDELDWWVNRSVFAGSAELILGELTAFATRRGAFSAILSHDWTSRGWEPRYEEGRLTLPSRRVRFLSRRDVEALTRLAEGVQFSGLAVDFLWRVSGGWPGLAQLLCHEAVELLRRGRISQTVDVGVMKSATRNILGSRDYAGFLAYLLGSLMDEEILILQWLAGSDRIQPESSEIQGLRYDATLGYRFELPATLKPPVEQPEELSKLLRGLEEKEILEEVGRGAAAKVRLRVGLLAYPLAYSTPAWR